MDANLLNYEFEACNFRIFLIIAVIHNPGGHGITCEAQDLLFLGGYFNTVIRQLC